MKKLPQYATTLLLTAVCSALVCASVRCMTSAFSMPQIDHLSVLTVLCCAVFCFAFSRKHGGIAAIVSAALLAAAAIVFFASLKNAFSALIDYLLGIYNSGYHWMPDADFSKRLSAAEIRPALLFLSALLAMLVSFSAVYLKSTFLCGLEVLPVLISCFILTDTPPDTLCLMLVLGSMILLALTQQSRKADPLRAPLAMLWFAVPTVLLLVILYLAVPQDTYDHDEMVGELTDKIVEVWKGSDDESTQTGGSRSRTAGDGDLHAQKSAPASNRTAMHVTAEHTGTLYLSGKAYAEFSDDTWKVVKRLRGFAPAKVDYAVPYEELTVSTADVSDVLYVPYGLLRCNADTDSYDAYCENGDKLTEYTVQYFPDSVTQSLWGWSSEAYTQLVRENCLSLPDDTREALLLWGEEHLPEDPTPQQIAKAVQKSATYSRYPKAIPEDADLAVYFLNEAESGFCVQFATATAELLRAYGYPSRYVTGYIVNAEAGETVRVPEKNAHAWAEVYDEASGWMMLESTPSEGVRPEQTEHTQRETQEATQPEKEKEKPKKPEKTDRPEKETDDQPQTKQTAKGLPRWSWLLLGFAVLIAILPVRRAVKTAIRNKALKKGTTNTKLCAHWRYYERLCRLTGEQPDKAVTALAQKAKFSQYRSTPQELQQVQSAIDERLACLKKQPLFKRLYYKYLLSLL